MANLQTTPIDFTGASGAPDTLSALIPIANISPPGIGTYTGGILIAPVSSQITSDPANVYATSG
jgi:hypothetical protein